MTGFRSLYGWFEETARRIPRRPAVELDGEALTYEQLRVRVARAAAVLAAHGLGRQDRVGLCTTRSLATYVGYLATLRLGAVVVPLSDRNPAARNRAMAAAAAVDLVLGGPDGGWGDGPVLPTDALDDGTVAEAPIRSVEAGDLAYVMFTSGSTGVPKGVPIRHGNVCEYIRHNVDRYQIEPGSRLTQTFELTFDPSVFDLFVSWGGGGTLVVPARQDVMEPVGFVTGRRITHWFSTPAAITTAEALRALPANSMPDLRWSLFAGEQLPLARAALWADAAPHSVVENLYGPTETTVTVTAYRLPARREDWPVTANGTVPIGRPTAPTEVVLLDGAGRPASTGELCVRGPQRFAGYLDAAEDAARFVRMAGGRAVAAGVPPAGEDWYRTGDRVTSENGQLVHLGRVDRQVKLRGYRVELEEVEAVLRTVPGVTEAAALVIPEDFGLDALLAFVTGTGLDTQALLAHLRLRLPPHAVPDRCIVLRNLPRTASEKIDRELLRRRFLETRRRPG